MKKMVGVLLSIIFAVSIILSGCSSGSNNANTAANQSTNQNTNNQNAESSEQEGNNDPVTLKFWRAGVEGNEHDYWVKAVERFNDSQGDIKVEYSDAGWDDMQTKLNVAFASNSAPDIIGHAINSLADRVGKGQYMAIDDLYQSWDGKDDLISFYGDAGKLDGKQYGVGWKVGGYLWAYRKDFFEEANLDPENPPKTWDELLEYAEKLTIRDGNVIKRAGLNFPTGDDRMFVTLLNQAGGQIANEQGEPAWNSPEAAEVLEFVNEIGKRNVAIPITQVNNDAQDQFAAGKAAMGMVALPWIQDMFANDASMREKVGFMMIGNERGAAWAGCEILFINGKTTYSKEAWKFMEFAMSEEEVMTRATEAGVAVVRESLMDDFIKSDPLLNEGLLLTVENGVSHAKTPWSSLFARNYAQKMIEEAQLTDNPAQEILDSYYEKMMNEMNP